MDRKWLRQVAREIAAYGQMGVYIVVPPIIMVLAASFIRKKTGYGAWVTIVSLILGLYFSYNSIRGVIAGFLANDTKNKTKNTAVSYRNHK